MRKKTTAQFIKEAKNIHGNKFEYSLIDYQNTNSRVTILCPEHGEFEQTPKQHLRGNGCPRCSGRYKTNEQFINEAKTVHGSRYDYCDTLYKKSTTPVKIKCRTHGNFFQSPNDHLTGYGCFKCLGKRKKTNEQFINEATTVHGNQYDYSKIEYIDTHHKVIIKCLIHGEFKQRPMDHLKGNGCPGCARRGYLTSKPGIVYYIKFWNDYETFYKIGITNGNLPRRIRRFQIDKSFKVEIKFSIKFDDGAIPPIIERSILTEFSMFRCKNKAKNIMKNGFTEVFICDVIHTNDLNMTEHTLLSRFGVKS